MGVYSRPDSPVWWLFLETTKTKERTEFRIGTTAAQKHDSRQLADDLYHQRMNEAASRLYRLPTGQPQIRFNAYADTYDTNTIAHHKGKERERELLKNLRAFFGAELLSTIDKDRAKAYATHRKQTVSARTVNREVDLLKAMLRDAVPKYLTASPLVGMKRLPIVQPKRRLLRPAEERKLLKKADRVERALLLVALDGLVRLGDLLDVQRTDRQGAWLRIPDPKSGEPYEVALSQRAARALEALPKKDGPYYFERYRGARLERDRRARVRRALMALCARADVRYGKKIGGITFHWATRRTGATRLVVQRKQPIPAVQRQGNWKTADVLLSIYTEADRDAQRRLYSRKGETRRKRA